MRERRSLLRRVRELPPPVADGLLAALIALIGIPQLYVESPLVASLGWDFRNPDALAVLLTLGQAVPLVWRRRAPRTVLAVTGLAAAVHLVLGYQPTWAQVGMLVALYTVAAHSPRRQSVVTGLLFTVGLVGYGVVAERMYPSATVEEHVQGWVFTLVQFATAWFLGDLQKRRLAYTSKLEALNAQLADEQELRARWAVAEERGRIARELHDVVAHRVSLMTVQAGAAKAVAAEDPEGALRAMGAVEEAGRQALDELRHLLGVLRPETDLDGLGPQPGLADLPRLVDQIRGAGLDVSLATDGVSAELPARVDLFAYRIVQEALTNVLKHAGPGAHSEVRLGTDRSGIVIEVLDDGQGSEPPSAATGPFRPAESPVGDRQHRRSGHGIVGMRERALLLGGTLDARPRPGGGFQVVAHLPTGGERA